MEDWWVGSGDGQMGCHGDNPQLPGLELRSTFSDTAAQSFGIIEHH